MILVLNVTLTCRVKVRLRTEGKTTRAVHAAWSLRSPSLRVNGAPSAHLVIAVTSFLLPFC